MAEANELTETIDAPADAANSGAADGLDQQGGATSEGNASDVGNARESQTEALPRQTQTATGGGQGAAPIDVDAALAAKELLAERLGAGLIEYDQYVKETAKHDKAIVTAQRQERARIEETIRPIQQQRQVTESNRRYFGTWGQGKDAANLKYGKSIPAKTAQSLFQQAEAEVEADPLYQNRPEFDLNTVVRMKWMDKLDAASKGKAPAPRTAAAAAPSQPQTRFSGSGGAGAQQIERDTRTAKEKLEAGEYTGIVDETDNLMKGL